MSQEQNFKFTKEHEWVSFNETTNTAIIGITDFAQKSLGDVVFIELPKIGRIVKANEVVGSVESVKTVSDIYSPLTGEVIEINTKLDQKPELINEDVYINGWIYKLKVTNNIEINSLLSFEEYNKIIG